MGWGFVYSTKSVGVGVCLRNDQLKHTTPLSRISVRVACQFNSVLFANPALAGAPFGFRGNVN